MINTLSSLGTLSICLGVAAAFLRWTSPTFGIYLILGGIVLAALMGIFAIFQLLKWGTRGTPMMALTPGLICLASLGGIGYFYYFSPINDFTSNTTKPPAFLRPVYRFNPEKGAEFLDKSFELDRSYRTAFAGVQNEKFPGLEPISVKLPMVDAVPVIDQAFKTAFPDWAVVLSEKNYSHLEAEAPLPYLRLISDVVIEARESKNNPSLLVVDYRIRSRFPFGDLGYGAQQMKQVRDALSPALEQAATKWANYQKNNSVKVGEPGAVPTLGNPPAAISDVTSPGGSL